jgi:hypothetical protein
MIHEYALEPDLAANWGNRESFRYFYDKFGLGQPRIVSRYPKKWRQLVWNAFGSTNDMERKRLEELLTRLTERMVKRRGAQYDLSLAWLDKALHEHERVPFHAIVARNNPTGSPEVLKEEQIGESPLSLWDVPRGLSVSRQADAMASAVASVLSRCQSAIFIDPHFGPENARHRRPLEKFLLALTDGRAGNAIHRMEVHTSAKAAVDFFQRECPQKLPDCIPKGLKVRIVRWKELESGGDLHNRYILTDLGGVIFPAGLDDTQSAAMDDVTLRDPDGSAAVRSALVVICRRSSSVYSGGSPSGD